MRIETGTGGLTEGAEEEEEGEEEGEEGEGEVTTAMTKTEAALVEEEEGIEMGLTIEEDLCIDVPTILSPLPPWSAHILTCGFIFNRTCYGLRHVCFEMDVEASNELEGSDARLLETGARVRD